MKFDQFVDVLKQHNWCVEDGYAPNRVIWPSCHSFFSKSEPLMKLYRGQRDTYLTLREERYPVPFRFTDVDVGNPRCPLSRSHAESLSAFLIKEKPKITLGRHGFGKYLIDYGPVSFSHFIQISRSFFARFQMDVHRPWYNTC